MRDIKRFVTLYAFGLLCLHTGLAQAAPFAYITNAGAGNVSVIDVATNAIAATVPLGTNPASVSVSPDGSRVYISNQGGNNVSVLSTATNTVTATVPVGRSPRGVAITPDGARAYVANGDVANISVLSTATNIVTATIPVGISPRGVAVTPDGSRVYVANYGFSSSNVSVISTATNTVIATVPVGVSPFGVAVTPDGTRVYVTNLFSNNVSVISTATNTVIATVPVGSIPLGVAITPDGSRGYVANQGGNTVSVIATASNTVSATVTVGASPVGVAITPDGAQAYVVNQNSNSVSVLSTASNAVTATVTVGAIPAAFGLFITPSAAPLPVATSAIEYYHAAFNHYFITAIPVEIAKLDDGTFVGWARTGLRVNVFATATSGTLVVCRFFSTAFAPKSSHFYTPFPAECATVKTNPDWTYEGDVFYVAVAAADGTCAGATTPVFRLYNNGEGGAPNHRYTTDAAVRDQMIAKGWIVEGNGPGLAFMCAPQ